MIADIVISLLIFAAVAGVIGRGIYNRIRHKGGSCSCGGCCSGCPGAGLCHPSAKPKT